jgi:NADH-quinone oxidoreductase subunit L
LVATAVALAGIIAAYAVYVRRARKPIEPEILEEGWKYDQLVTAFMGGPGRKAFDALAWFDRTIIDGAVMGTGRTVARTAGQLRRGQTGNIRNYAEILGVGVVLLLAWFVIGRGIL